MTNLLQFLQNTEVRINILQYMYENFVICSAFMLSSELCQSLWSLSIFSTSWFFFFLLLCSIPLAPYFEPVLAILMPQMQKDYCKWEHFILRDYWHPCMFWFCKSSQCLVSITGCIASLSEVEIVCQRVVLFLMFAVPYIIRTS